MQRDQSSRPVVVVGGGAAGMVGAIAAARRGARVIVCERMAKPGVKLTATGGGRCNLTNTLDVDEFMGRWGKTGRFMGPALRLHDAWCLRTFFESIGVASHAPDGYRVWPITHDARTVQQALAREVEGSGGVFRLDCEVQSLRLDDGRLVGVETTQGFVETDRVLVATGGKGYPMLGSTGGGFLLAEQAGHRVRRLHPAMQPLFTRERWPERCRAHTIAGVEVRIDLPKARRVCVVGDLLFTRDGIAGPVVMNLAREVIPFLDEHGEVPLKLKLTRGTSEDTWVRRLKSWRRADLGDTSTHARLSRAVPAELAEVFCELAKLDPTQRFLSMSGAERARLGAVLAVTPLTVIGSEGWKRAMVTRGGVSLREVDPETLESRVLPGLYFAGEVVDLDGPCGGFNLTWAFASGLLAGQCLVAPETTATRLYEGSREEWEARPPSDDPVALRYASDPSVRSREG